MTTTTAEQKPTREEWRGFADQTVTLDEAIRRERRPLPAHDLSGCNYRRWAAAVLTAEVKHATEDFWRVAYKLNYGLAFDHYKRDLEASSFRFEHERLAGVAAVWLLHLQSWDSDRYGVWSRWLVMNRHERIAWARRRRELVHGFLRACHFYQSERAKVDAPTVERRAA